jgi:hypothetical protein
MGAAAATTALMGACLLAGHALADTIPIPPLPTVTVPTVTIPTVTAPTLPPPTLPAPSPVPVPTSTTAAVPAVPSVSSPVASSTPGGGSSLGSSSASSPAYASAGGPGSERTSVERFDPSRGWIATSGPKRRRVTTLTFVLPRAARVVFVVKQVSPVCRVVGHFAVNGHAGRNRVRFPRRASNLKLDPGTYRITARTRAGRIVQRVTIVVVNGGVPTRAQIIAARASNVCPAAERLAAAASGSTGALNTPAAGRPSASGPSGGIRHSGAVLASSVEKAARAVRPVLVALLALSIVLLAIASLPRLAVPESRANELLARHRMEIAGLGTAAFVAVVIAFLLG